MQRRQKSGSGVLKRVTVNTLGCFFKYLPDFTIIQQVAEQLSRQDPDIGTGYIPNTTFVFNTGLTIVTATGTAADLTIVYQ